MGDPQDTELRERMSLRKWLFNPFHRIAGGPALAMGAIGILATGLVGYFSNTHLDGVLDLHTMLPGPLWLFVAEGVINWLTMGILLLLAGLVTSPSRIRPMDVLGTQALARAPMLLATVFTLLPGYQRFTAELVANLSRGAVQPPSASGDAVAFGITTVVMLVSIVWMVALMYRGFAVSCNVSGARPILLFIVALVLAEIGSKIAIARLIRISLASPIG
jgi:hypothetical protein